MIVSVFITICHRSRDDQPRQTVTRNFNWRKLDADQVTVQIGTHASDPKIDFPIQLDYIRLDDVPDTGTLTAFLEHTGVQYQSLLDLAHSRGFTDV